MDELLNTQNAEEVESVEATATEPEPLIYSEGDRRLIQVWESIDIESDIAVALAELLSSSNSFTYALTLANEVNDRQGKNRISFSNDQRRLMEVSYEDNVDAFQDKTLMDLFKYILNIYLMDKQSIPQNKPKKAAGIEGRVKVLIVLLFTSGQYGVINDINLPDWIKPSIDKIFQKLHNDQDEILDMWIDWLDSHEDPQFADIVRSLGRSFWGADGTSPDRIFNSKFHGIIHKLTDYQATYEAYLYFRGEYIKTTRSFESNYMFDILGLTHSKYDTYREAILNEFQQIFSEDENAVAIQKLIFQN